MGKLNGRKVAVLATDGVEQIELTEPVKALKAEGADVSVVSLKEGTIQGYNHHEKGDKIPVDVVLSQAKAANFDALVLPGGVISPDALRVEGKAVAFVKDFVTANKPIGAICHGPWTLIEAGAVKGRKMTSWPSLQTDLRNAGATWVDEPVVQDAMLVTSRKPDDLPGFCAKLVDAFAKAA